ncbi:hypothetical protein R1flu_016985 [Riccia fluitans]|uniref:Uncharacterized protein n=1 Tax=Riccia fluitans TaxID=41844 RepID=A0ABD1YND8_9MARC
MDVINYKVKDRWKLRYALIPEDSPIPYLTEIIILIVKDSETPTPKLRGTVLPGITSKRFIALAGNFGYELLSASYDE